MIVLIFFCLHLGKIVFRELCLMLLLCLLYIQTSSLWRSVNIVPIRVLMVFSFTNVNNFSGLLVIIYIIVFIGGLLIFLVRVASLTPQEQNISLNLFLLIFLIVFTLPFVLQIKTSHSSRILLPYIWRVTQPYFYLFIVIVFLVALLILTKFFIRFKGLIRSLYNNFV